MASVMAIVSKAVFEKDARPNGKLVGVGDVWPTDRYASQNKGLAPLSEGGDLYLVTVRPHDEALWLVAVLRAPKSEEGHWRGAKNVVPVANISTKKGELRFANGAGLSAKAGALGMSLQTPRILTDADIACLSGTAAASPPPAPKTAPAPKAAPAPKVAGAPAADADEQLTSALAHLAEDRLEPAIADILTAWRKYRAPAIAELLEAVTTELDRSLPAFEGKNTHAPWLQMAGRKRVADVGRLLAGLERGTIPELRERYQRLTAFAPDPRLVKTMLTLPTRYHSYEAGPLLSTAFDVAARTNEPGTVAIIDDLLATFFVPVKGDSTAWKEHLAKHARRATKTREGITVAPALPAPVAAQVKAALRECARLAKRTDVPRREDTSEPATTKSASGDLLASILANFDDDEALVVYSDALQQAGDPRGEFIALQLEQARRGKLPAAGEKRMRELAKEHGRAWTAPLDGVIRPDSIRFERGFLSACRIEGGTLPELRAVEGHPLWSTVRELDCDLMRFATNPVFAKVKRGTYTAEGLATLAKSTQPVALEAVIGTLEMSYGLRLRFGIPLENEAKWGAALDVGALGSLRSLQIYNEHLEPKALRFLLDSKLGAQLRELDLFGEPPLAGWLTELTKRKTELLLRIRFTNNNTASGTTAILATFEVKRAGKGFDVDIAFNNEMADLRFLTIPRQITHFLADLPPGERRARVRYTGSKKRTKMGFPAIVDTLRAAFADLTLE